MWKTLLVLSILVHWIYPFFVQKNRTSIRMNMSFNFAVTICVWRVFEPHYLSHGKPLNKFTTYHMTPKPILYAKFPGSGGVCECREVRWRSISDVFSSTYARRAASASTSRSAGRSAAKAKSTASASAGSPLRVAATTRTSETPSKTRIFLKPRIFRDGRAEWWIGDACSGWLMGLITHKVTHSCILIWSYRK